MEVSIVLPTYNESKNIEELLKRIFDSLDDVEVVVVDDGSPDGTAAVVEGLQDSFKNLKLVERGSKRGLGSAYKKGFSVCTGRKVVQMDADFSHSVSDIPRLLGALDKADFVVGSRYVEGGERRDSWMRRIMPALGRFLYGFFLDFPVNDFTSGFKAYKRCCLEFLTDKSLPDGFEYQPASLKLLLDEGFCFEEVPIVFHDRKRGDTKYRTGAAVKNFRLFLRLLSERFLT